MQINRSLLAFCRTVHIYLTMLGLLVMLLFGVTGFTINHEEWFGATTPRVSEADGRTNLILIQKNDRLGIVEHLRSDLRVTGAVTAFDDLGDKLSIGFKDPGQQWEVEIEKVTGNTHVHGEAYNLVALINNLHRGRYSGPAWRWVIDVAAIFIALACATGVVLWLALPKRRKLGLAAFAAGVLLTLVVYCALVPGPDAAPATAPPVAAAP